MCIRYKPDMHYIQRRIEKGMKALVLKMLQNGISKELIVKGISIFEAQIEEWEKAAKNSNA